MQISDQFKKYWYSGKAEISTYSLEQYRYGEPRKGELIYIFVTEDFRTDKQVKNERYLNVPTASVLKLNAIYRFKTGIYDYQLMSSSFTKIQSNLPILLKYNLSRQDWCGQSFMQLNLSGEKRYRVKTYSYFESQSDKEFYYKKFFSEDEIPSLIRLNPSLLPIGNIKIIPSGDYLELTQKPFKEHAAVATLALCKNSKLNQYKISYKNGRDVSFCFQKKFPYTIEQITKTKSGNNKKAWFYKANRKKTMHIDYWNKKQKKDTFLQKRLGIVY